VKGIGVTWGRGKGQIPPLFFSTKEKFSIYHWVTEGAHKKEFGVRVVYVY
jgi:hypothetical protein